ncbi:MAG: pyrimidine-nucleoside phosphorylase [Firmicutes bacterium]|nr:pyrimidine-nucleoside phosphorylase [Bacillota bacterium]
MRAYDLILKKRNGGELTTAEIEFLISGYTAGEIADYQMAALCMAIYFQGMSIRETADLTMAMAYSGDVNDLSGIEGTVIDKHSTGGVGDTTTLIVAPLVASCGVPVAKMSGRGLGHTGGTIDKLESIPGFQTEISQTEFVQQVNQIKLGLIAQTEALVPADKQLYALRDVTATVDSIPLIAASIMSKKIASGADGFVLDVKTGRGALMQNYAQSEVLAKTMVAIGKKVGKPTVALITDMDQPLGYAVGNALEVKEAISVLSGQGAADLTDLCLHLGAEMLVLAGHSPNQESGYKVVEQKLKSKAGLEKFRELISWQGGDPRVVGDLSLLPQASYQTEVRSRQSGYVSSIDALKIGSIAMQLGAGRKTKNSSIDLGVGIELKAKVGGYVERDQPLAVIHSNQPLQQEPQLVLNAFSISQARPQQRPLIWAKITEADV